jgi:competence protein ComEC
LSAGALVVLAINPADLFRPGPQLSFLAMAVLIHIGNQGGLIPAGPSDRLDRGFAIGGPKYLRALVRGGRSVGWLGAPPDRLEQLVYASLPWYRRTVARCLGTIRWLMYSAFEVWWRTLPLVLMHFHVASPISVLISPLVWAFVFVAMWSGFFMLTIGWLVASIGRLCGKVCSDALWGLDSVVEWAESVESLPCVDLLRPGPALWWVVGFYFGLITVMFLGRSIFPFRWRIAALSAWILVGLAPPITRTITRDGLVCSFVAVGHGTCVVLETPSGKTILYDAGALRGPEFATQSIASYLWHRGITTIDGIVISHADVDHYNAVPRLLKRFAVKAVYVSPMMFDGLGDAEAGGGPQLVQAAIREAAVPIHKIWGGTRLKVDRDVSIDVLHPPRNGVLGNDNANSLTLAVEYDGRRILLPGDLESPGLEDVIAELPYDCDVLLAPHHGSRQSDPPGFAAWSTPEWVVVSGSGDDDVRLVVDTYSTAGAEVIPTADRGAVHFCVSRDSIRVATNKRPRTSETGTAR